MKTSIVTGTQTLEALKELFDWSDEVELAYAWASSAGGTATHWKALDLSKVRRAVIGTQFAQTEPLALSQLDEKAKELLVVITSEGTFHPKLTWGERGNKFRALMGSSNLTVGGFSYNTELNVLVEGALSDPQAAAIRQFLDDAYEQGVPLEPAWFVHYQIAYRNRPKSSGLVPAATIEGETLAALDMPWSKFVEIVLGSAGAALKEGNRLRLLDPESSYFWELDRAQEIYRMTKRFVDMPSTEQHFLLGRGATSGYFGNMGASLGTAKAIKDRPDEIGDVLDAVPMDGIIDPATALAYTKGLMAIHGIGLAVATRALCVKRPDTFVSVNEANREAFERLGHPVRSSATRYMALLEAVWNTRWYKTGLPKDALERRLWSARAAILDAAVYRG